MTVLVGVGLDGAVRSCTADAGRCGQCGQMRCLWATYGGHTVCVECHEARPLLPAWAPRERAEALPPGPRYTNDSGDVEEPRWCVRCGAVDGLDAPCTCHIGEGQ